MIIGLIIAPILFAWLTIVIRHHTLRHILLILGCTTQLAIAIYAYFHLSEFQGSNYLCASAESLITLMTVSFSFWATALYFVFENRQFLKARRGTLSPKDENSSVAFASINLILLSIITLFLFVENWFLIIFAVFLIAGLLALLFFTFQDTPNIHSLIRFLFVATIGCGFITLGIILISGDCPTLSAPDEAMLSILNSQHIPQINLAIIFFIIGFGMFIGIAPLHAWLPNFVVHHNPTLSAVTSTTLLTVGLWGFFRIIQINSFLPYETSLRPTLLSFGIVTLLLSAFFAIIQLNYKRLIAYLAIAQCGLLLVSTAILPEIFPSECLHLMIWIILTTTLLYLLSGNIQRVVQTSISTECERLFRHAPLTAATWIIAILILCALPPFGIFSAFEVTIQACFQQESYVILSLLVVGELILFATASAHILAMLKQSSIRDVRQSTLRESWVLLIPCVFIMAWMVYWVAISDNLFMQAVQVILQHIRF